MYMTKVPDAFELAVRPRHEILLSVEYRTVQRLFGVELIARRSKGQQPLQTEQFISQDFENRLSLYCYRGIIVPESYADRRQGLCTTVPGPGAHRTQMRKSGKIIDELPKYPQA